MNVVREYDHERIFFMLSFLGLRAAGTLTMMAIPSLGSSLSLGGYSFESPLV